MGGLSTAPLNPIEQKQLKEIQSSLAILQGKLAGGAVDESTGKVLMQLSVCVAGKDYAGANQLQTQLANSVWKAHKDFLKGTKFLIQLAQKKQYIKTSSII